MHSEQLTYQADGLTMHSQLFFEAGVSGRRPGILVFPEANGLGEHAISRAKRLAGLGYIALACDLHGNGETFVMPQQMEQVLALLAPLRENPARIRARAQGGLTALASRPEVDAKHIAAIGFCFGGTMSLELARSGAPIAAAVGFHSGLATAAPGDAHQIKGKVLVCIGADDPAVPAEQRQAFEAEMRAGKVNWQLNVYGGVVHSFTNPAVDAMGRPEMMRYDPQTDARSWAEMQALFKEVFAP
jgi:dienelactone hydrolase